MTLETRTFQILLAEDRPEDADLVRMALKKHRVQCTLHVIRDGAKAIEWINGLDSDRVRRLSTSACWTCTFPSAAARTF